MKGPVTTRSSPNGVTVGDFTAEAQGPSKKAAKTLASAMALNQLQRLSTPAAKKTTKKKKKKTAADA